MVPAAPGFVWEVEPSRLNVCSFGWYSDLFKVDAVLSNHYLGTYFNYENNAFYRIFPHQPFECWARGSGRKSAEDFMMLYAILGVGSIFGPEPDHSNHGPFFCEIARFAMVRTLGKFSLQLTRRRLLLALYHYSVGSVGEQQISWGYGGMAIRAATGLRLDLENNFSDNGEDEGLEYGLDKRALINRHRRTFWSTYLIDVSSLRYQLIEIVTNLSKTRAWSTATWAPLRDSIFHIRGTCKQSTHFTKQPCCRGYFLNI